MKSIRSAIGTAARKEGNNSQGAREPGNQVNARASGRQSQQASGTDTQGSNQAGGKIR